MAGSPVTAVSTVLNMLPYKLWTGVMNDSSIFSDQMFPLDNGTTPQAGVDGVAASFDAADVLQRLQSIVPLYVVGTCTLLVLWGMWQRYTGQKPINVRSVGFPTFLGRWVFAILHHFRARTILDNEMLRLKNGGKSDGALCIPTSRGFDVAIFSEEHINDYNRVPVSALHVKYHTDDFLPREAFFGGLTLSRLEMHQNFLHNLFRVHLTARTTAYFSEFAPRFASIFRRYVAEGHYPGMPSTTTTKKPQEATEGGWRLLTGNQLNETMRPLFAWTVMGSKFGLDESFSALYRRYSWDILLFSELFRPLPGPLFKFFGKWAMRLRGNLQALYDVIDEEIELRTGGSSSGSNREAEMRSVDGSAASVSPPQGEDASTPAAEQALSAIDSDAIDGVLELSKDQGRECTVRQVIALLFSLSQQMGMMMTFALYYLCKYPEYLEPLRAEAAHFKGQPYSNSERYMPLLDSFFREVARLQPISLLTIHHKAVRNIHFSDGMIVPAGNRITIATHVLHQDAHNYESPADFRPFRFVEKTDAQGEEGKDTEARTMPKQRFTDVSNTYVTWGQPTRPCPGRFYGSMFFKMAMSELMLNYDIRLLDPDCPVSLDWHSGMVVPHPKVKFLVRERERE